MPFEATITNPLPKGLVHTKGSFGPWRKGNPGGSPLSGRYTFDDVDLSTVKGIAGKLTSTGEFGGQLDRIDVKGETRTPDFRLKVSGNPVPLHTKFVAVVDGTDGDTYLNDVSATFLQTSLTAKGAIIGAEGVKGRTVRMQTTIEDGRIEDILRLVVKGNNPLMSGSLDLRGDMNLPAGPADVMDRLEVSGDLGVDAARFNDGGVQAKISNMSERARGMKPEEHADNVASNFRAKFRLERRQLTLHEGSFGIPGATVQMAGTYGLETESFRIRRHPPHAGDDFRSGRRRVERVLPEGGRSALPQAGRRTRCRFGCGAIAANRSSASMSARRSRPGERPLVLVRLKPDTLSLSKGRMVEGSKAGYLPPFAIDPRKSALLFVFPIFDEQQLHRFDGGERREHLAQDPHAVEIFLRNEQLFFPRAALLDVDRREDAAVGELAIEVDFQVAGALELLEDHFVHAASRCR